MTLSNICFHFELADAIPTYEGPVHKLPVDNPVLGMSIGLVVIGWFASIVVFLATFPGAWKIIRTRQTFFLSKWMWILTMSALINFVIYGGLLGAQAQLDGWPGAAVAAGYSLVVFDGINFILCGVILAYKLYNQNKAKKLNISEEQLCLSFLDAKTKSKSYDDKKHSSQEVK